MTTVNLYGYRGWGWFRRRYLKFRPNHCWLHYGTPRELNRRGFVRGLMTCPEDELDVLVD